MLKSTTKMRLFLTTHAMHDIGKRITDARKTPGVICYLFPDVCMMCLFDTNLENKSHQVIDSQMHTHTHTRTHARTHARTQTYTHININTHTHTHTYLSSMLPTHWSSPVFWFWSYHFLVFDLDDKIMTGEPFWWVLNRINSIVY